MQMTFDSTSISLRRVYFSIGKFCEGCLVGRAIDEHGTVKLVTGLSNHSQQTTDGSAQRTQRGILNTDGKDIAKLCAAYTISV